jgi:hypothetical protein
MKHVRAAHLGLLLAVAAGSFALYGCGTSSAGGGAPVPQPVTQPSPQTGGNGGTGNPSGQKQPPAKQGEQATGQSTQGSSTANSGGTQPNSGGSTQPAGGSTQSAGQSKGTGGGQNSGSTQTVTITVNQGALTSAPASSQSGGGNFVPATGSVTSVLIPKGWKQTEVGSDILRLINPADQSQVITEDVSSSPRDLQGFYANLSPGSASWWVRNQVVRFTIQNPNSPYLDQGIAANTASGGSIRVDVYLPAAESGMADQILRSFVTQATGN